VIGFSFGGSWALWLAQHRPEWIRAVTLFYGTDGGSGNYFRSKASFLGHFAEGDPYEPDEVVGEVERLLKEARRPTTFYTYPGAGHWFAEDDRPDAYNATAAELAWERTVAFLHKRLDGGSG
jgi:carboxymethylenebutenolidase